MSIGADKRMVWGLVVLAVIVMAAAAWAKFGSFPAQAKEFADFGKILVSFFTLIVVALFIERVVEVFAKGWRAPRREQFEIALQKAKDEAIGALHAKGPVAPEQKAAFEASAVAESEAVRDAETRLGDYRSETRRYSFLLSTVLGLLAALVGVRALALFIAVPAIVTAPGNQPPPTEAQALLFTALDVFVTGFLLAGGAEGLHKIVDTFTTWMDETKKGLKS